MTFLLPDVWTLIEGHEIAPVLEEHLIQCVELRLQRLDPNSRPLGLEKGRTSDPCGAGVAGVAGPELRGMGERPLNASGLRRFYAQPFVTP